MDQIDKKIVNALMSNARLSMSELSAKVGLSKSPTQTRVKKLERDGIILGYSARINHEKTDSGHIAFVQVTLNDTRANALDAFNDAVKKTPEISQCHMMAASFDYLLKVRTKDISAYRRVLGEVISALPHVSQTSTFVAMEAVKDH